MSQTTKVKVNFRDLDMLKVAAEELDGECVVRGDQAAVRLPGWHMDAVLGIKDGVLTGDMLYDRDASYSGITQTHMDKLAIEYAMAAANAEAVAHGWHFNRQGEKATISTPKGRMEITADAKGSIQVDGQGYSGTACAGEIGEIVGQVGTQEQTQYKQEYHQSHTRVRQREQG